MKTVGSDLSLKSNWTEMRSVVVGIGGWLEWRCVCTDMFCALFTTYDVLYVCGIVVYSMCV